MERDGVTYINTYSKGETRLGRDLSNFAPFPFELDGIRFTSVEAYWYWRRAMYLNDFKETPRIKSIRKLYGYPAKKEGRVLVEHYAGDKPLEDDNVFRSDVKRAIREKIVQNPDLYKRFIESELPFQHMYVYGKGEKSVSVVPKDAEWLNPFFLELREKLKLIYQEDE